MMLKILGLPSDIGKPGEELETDNRGLARGPVRAVGSYRIKWPFDWIRATGLAEEIDYYAAPGQLAFELVRDFDVVVMQRQTMPHHITLMEHVSSFLKNRIAVYDFDDDLMNLDPANPAYIFWGDDKRKLWSAFEEIRDNDMGRVDAPERITPDMVYKQAQLNRLGFAEMLSSVDLITVSTDYLKAKYLPLTATPIEVVPNGIVESSWANIDPIRVAEGTVIGWAGGFSHKSDLQMIAGAVAQVAKRNEDVTLALIGWPGARDVFPAWMKDRIVTVDWLPMDEYRAYVKGFDIGLAPAARTAQNMAKSPIRVFELGLAGVPVVASEVCYGRFVPDGSGYVAQTVRQFGKAIEKLIRAGHEKRCNMGTVLKDYVLNKHTVAHTGARMLEVYEDALERKKANN